MLIELKTLPIKYETPSVHVEFLDEEIPKTTKDTEEIEFPLAEIKKLGPLEYCVNFFRGFYELILENFYTILLFIMLIVGVIIYDKTLEPCTKEEKICIKTIGSQLMNWFLIIWIVSMMYSGMILAMYYRKITRLFCIPLIGCLLYIFFVSNGWTYSSHGNYNNLVLIALIAINISLFVIFRKYYKFIKKTKYPGFALFMTLVIYTLMIGLVNYIGNNGCQRWGNGFNNTRILTKETYCKLENQNLCWYNYFNLLNDFIVNQIISIGGYFLSHPATFYMNLNLTELALLKNNLVSLPQTNHWSNQDRSIENFENNIINNMRIINSMYQETNNSIEVLLNDTSFLPQISFFLKRNETVLQKARENLENAKNKPLTKNVIAIYLDEISRSQFISKFKTTFKWIEQFYNNSNSSHEAYQFYRYHAVSDNIKENFMSTYFGIPVDSQNGQPLNKAFRNQGFITAASHNYCSSQHFIYHENEAAKIAFEPYDYENLALFCYPFSSGPIKQYKEKLSYESDLMANFFGKNPTEYIFQYSKEFWNVYPNESKFLDLGLIDLKSKNEKELKDIDYYLSNFLKDMSKKEFFNETTILIYSVIGAPLNLISYLTENIGASNPEVRLPAMFLMLPRNIANQYGEKLRSNEQVLTSGYDIHNLMESLSGCNENTWRGGNLFESIQSKRNCKNIYANSCVCQ